MKKLRSFLAVTAFITVLAFTGCASKNTEQQSTQVKDQPKVEEVQKNFTISQGSQNMRDALKNMKASIAAKNEDETIREGAKLEENWSKFEDSVKDKNKDLYDKVEGPLDIINAAIKVKPVDIKVLTSEIDSLDNILSAVQKIK